MKNCLLRSFQAILVFSLVFTLTNCGNLDNPLEELSGGSGSDETPTVEDIIKYGFKVTDLAGIDRTEAVTSLKMTKADGTLVAEAEVSAYHKITIKNTDLSAAAITAAADFWFEAEIGGKPYIAKVNIDPTALSPESDKTLAMATLGDVILSDGKFAARTSTGTNVAMIAYLGSSTGVDDYTHGLALALSDVSANTLSWDNTHANNASKTAAKWCSDWNTSKTITGGTWMLPSKDQWTNMITAAGGYDALRDGFSGISGGFNLQSDVYWTCTEDDSGKAWTYNFDNGNWGYGSKVLDFRVRACLAF